MEVVLRTKFIPALLGLAPSEVNGDLRQVLTHSVKMGGLAIRNPVDTATHVHEASMEATSHLTRSLVEAGVAFDLGQHKSVASKARQDTRNNRMGRERCYLGQRGEEKAAVKRRDKRNCRAGIWLSVIPTRMNGTSLSANEWRDNARLRYNLKPLDMPQLCDGCMCPMSVEHALSCKKGGLVHIRHDDVADEWRHLCGTATTFSKVTREPRIYSSVSRRVVVAGNPETEATTPATVVRNANTTTPPGNPYQTQQTRASNITEERGDAGCHGFWERGKGCVFDMRITDTECRSNRNKDIDKVLAAHEKEKKDKYLHKCHEERMDFTPMVYSVDGIAGREARHAEKHLATYLSEKWKRGYPEMCFYVRVRMALAVVKANSLLIRGSRDRQKARRPQICDRASMYDWRVEQDC